MRDDILKEVTERLKSDYGMKESGDKKYLQKGRCPACKSKDSLWASALNPAILHCQRANDCGREFDVKNLYPEIFDNWSKRHPKTEAEPDAAADAYLTSARGLKIGRLKGSYSQEIYEHPSRRDLRTATVRFPLPGGGYWERFIDQPGRFGKMKAAFKMGSSYKGYAWTAPDQPIDKLAHADRIWITEGIFDAASWQQVGEFAVSAMSTNNYPDKFLAALKKSIADQNVVGAPLLIFAFDIGPAGERYSKKYVEQAKKEGWSATAALPAAEGETGVKDWNDLLRRDRLSKEDAESYLWNGRILLAKDAHEKAVLIWEKHEWSAFSFVHDCRTWWATFDEAKINEACEKSDITRKAAARRCCNVTEIANCAFRVLYSQFNKTLEERHFYLSIRLPWSTKVYGAKFTPAAMTASSEFKKVLMGAGNGAMWTGSGFQLDKIVGRQMVALKEVETLDFTGYSREHEAYVFGDIAVHNGRVIKPHEDDYFECGDALLKLRGTDRILDITYDPERFDRSFVDAIWRAFGGHGMVTLTFFIMSMFAEQIRIINKSLLFIEMSGDPGTGKTTLIEFLWKLYGREGYEGLDPSTATFAAVSRNMASTSNIPVVFMEGDRDDNAPHQRKFDWNPLKKIYGGKPFRETGQKNNGQETNAPPFKASLIIEQNDAVNASPAIMERIISMKFTKDGWSQDTKRAAEALEQWPIEEVSGTVIHVVQREKAYLATFREKHPIWETAFITGTHRVRNSRIRKCAAQLHAGLDAMAPIFNLPQSMVEQVHRHINELAVARDKSLESDHPVVADFWAAFDYLTAINHEKDPNDILGKGVNVHRKGEDTIAVNLQAFEAACRAAGISHPPIDKLKAHLGTSKSRRFVGTGTVNTRNYGHLHCWQFLSEEATERQKPTAKGK